MKSRVYFHHTYQAKLATDIRSARGRIVSFSPYATPDGVQRWLPDFRAAVDRGVHVCVFIQEPDGWKHRDDPSFPLPGYVRTRIKKTMDAIGLLLSVGVHVTLRKDMHEKLFMMDDCVLWDGSLNFLSHYKTTERLNRWVSRAVVMKALIQHDALCRTPHARLSRAQPRFVNLGKHILRRRELLGWSQKQLAARAETSQRTISDLECGTHNVTLDLIGHVCDVLGLDISITESYLWHSVESLTVAGSAKSSFVPISAMRPLNLRLERIGKYIIEKRVLLGWTQQRLATFARTSQRVISQIETGKRNIRMDLLGRICWVLGLDVVVTDAQLLPEVDAITASRRTHGM